MESFIGSHLEKPKILVVDDRPENLVATRKILKGIDADIVEAGSGNEALIKMLHQTFSVVLLDVQMPEMDGFEVAKLIREDDFMRDTPIIFVTAISKEERYVDQAAEIGAVDYIFKPINPNILRSKILVFVEIFKQKQQLSLLNEALARSNKDLESFACIASHDLQEPLRSIISYSELVLVESGDQLVDDAEKNINKIIEGGKRMKTFLRDLLEYSKITIKGKEAEEVDTNGVLKDVLADLSSAVQESNAKVTVEGVLPSVKADHSQIHRLFQNLIGNSLKFRRKGADPTIQIKGEVLHDGMVEFHVIDNGIGIDAKHAESIFEPFKRLHTRTSFPGTGIGLSVCQRIVHRHGGEIIMQPGRKEGACFSFTLPDSNSNEKGD